MDFKLGHCTAGRELHREKQDASGHDFRRDNRARKTYLGL